MAVLTLLRTSFLPCTAHSRKPAAMIIATVSSSMLSFITEQGLYWLWLTSALQLQQLFLSSSAFLAALLLITSNILPYIDTSRISRTSPINTTTIPVITTEATVSSTQIFDQTDRTLCRNHLSCSVKKIDHKILLTVSNKILILLYTKATQIARLFPHFFTKLSPSQHLFLL